MLGSADETFSLHLHTLAGLGKEEAGVPWHTEVAWYTRVLGPRGTWQTLGG